MNQKWEYFCSRQPQLPLIKSKVLLTTNMAIHQTLSLGFCPPSALISTFDSDVWSKIGPKLSHLLEKKSFYWQYNDGSTSLNTQTLKVKWQGENVKWKFKFHSSRTLSVIKHKDFLRTRHELSFMGKIKKIKWNFTAGLSRKNKNVWIFHDSLTSFSWHRPNL